ncbi:uncharacterized protein EKO05_0005771 [Ascochyta rabiei]|uniref:Uncharacterized protein n=1 Tax=Didymella rabiei TaxID=5454 RepID=A0A163FBD4_DIDRA|nr:uncharacterized protein EKO05_0005771 [Ascochyta rabiei]KZM24245.1 hypothetical protein ST47_g4604 [Ascochyta rabiei]UPX15322.1 hypothetical protein EKO05_0005771 [Ascochyta rabiei]
MAPQYGHGARRTAHHITHAHGGAPHHISSANSSQLGHQDYRTVTRRDRNGARETERKRDPQKRRLEASIPRIPSPKVPTNQPTRLVDRMTYDRSGEVQDPIGRGSGGGLSPLSQHERRLQDRITRDDDFGCDSGLVQSASRHHDYQGRGIRSNSEDADNGMNVNNKIINSYDIFAPNPLLTIPANTPRASWQPLNTKPVQYGSIHHLPSDSYIQWPRPVQPATRPEPIRLLNLCISHEQATSPKATPATVPPPTATRKTITEPKRRLSPYKGNDVVKRLVQNRKLQLLLSGKPMPKPRKAADRMVLKCAGRKEIR